MFAPPATPSSRTRQTLFPSPLSPRSANAQRLPSDPSSYKSPSHSHNHSMALMTMPPSPPVTPPSEGFFAHTTRRVDIPTPASLTTSRHLGQVSELRRSGRTSSGTNPLLRSADVQRRVRRERYLGDVRGRREEVMWGTRGDQILQLDFMQISRRWDAEHARMAPSLPEEIGAEDVDVDMEEEEAGSQLDAPGRSNATGLHNRADPWHDLQQNNTMKQSSSRYEKGSSKTPNATNPNIQTSPTPQEVEEIDLLLQAEAREFDELVAFHERQSQEQNTSEHHHHHRHHHQQQRNSRLSHRPDDDGSPRHVMSSSPVYGSENDDDDFEDALVQIASRVPGEDEVMDLS